MRYLGCASWCVFVFVTLGGACFAQTARLDPWLDGLSSPVGIENAGDGSGRLFIVQRGGLIRIATEQGTLLGPPFVDLDALAGGSDSGGDERGLLGLAFIPDYDPGDPSRRCFFVNYTDTGGDTVIARVQTDASDPNLADAVSHAVVLELDQPNGNHNGGDLAFGPDGYLYVSVGDGGGSGDPNDNGQDKDTLLGSVLRLDVSCSGPATYSSPAGNPFVGVAGADEIWAWGLRNPWRISFDRWTGDLYIADVGQRRVEEVNFQPATSEGGENYGWDCREGSTDYGETDDPGSPSLACNPMPATVDPVLEYGRNEGNSITGGYVVRNAGPLHGLYVFGDYGSGRIWGGSPAGRGVGWTRDELVDTAYDITSFGEDEEGTLYVAHLGGDVFRLQGIDEIFSSGFESGAILNWSDHVP